MMLHQRWDKTAFIWLFWVCLVWLYKVVKWGLFFPLHPRYTGAPLVRLAVDSYADISGHRYSSSEAPRHPSLNRFYNIATNIFSWFTTYFISSGCIQCEYQVGFFWSSLAFYVRVSYLLVKTLGKNSLGHGGGTGGRSDSLFRLVLADFAAVHLILVPQTGDL